MFDVIDGLNSTHYDQNAQTIKIFAFRDTYVYDVYIWSYIDDHN